MTTSPKLLLISGSAREGSLNQRLVQLAGQLVVIFVAAQMDIENFL